MDRAKAKVIRGEILKALRKVSVDHDIDFSLGNITFTDQDFSVKLRGIDINATSANTALELDWDRYKHRYPELREVILHQQFTDSKGVTFQIVGLKPKNRKYPVIAERTDNGKSFKFSPYSVSVYLGNRV